MERSLAERVRSETDVSDVDDFGDRPRLPDGDASAPASPDRRQEVGDPELLELVRKAGVAEPHRSAGAAALALAEGGDVDAAVAIAGDPRIDYHGRLGLLRLVDAAAGPEPAHPRLAEAIAQARFEQVLQFARSFPGKNYRKAYRQLGRLGDDLRPEAAEQLAGRLRDDLRKIPRSVLKERGSRRTGPVKGLSEATHHAALFALAKRKK